MPYELVRVLSKKKDKTGKKKTLGFKIAAVKGEDKKPTHYFSKKPLPKKRALAQMRALYASEHRY